MYINAITYSLGSWMFNLDLFGYGLMAFSTLLIGITLLPKNKTDKWLKALLMIHSIFMPACVMIPILGLFRANESTNENAVIGILILLAWCACFIPVAVLSAIHFKIIEGPDQVNIGFPQLRYL